MRCRVSRCIRSDVSYFIVLPSEYDALSVPILPWGARIVGAALNLCAAHRQCLQRVAGITAKYLWWVSFTTCRLIDLFRMVHIVCVDFDM